MLCILCLLSEKTGARNLLSQNFHLGKKTSIGEEIQRIKPALLKGKKKSVKIPNKTHMEFSEQQSFIDKVD